jgi:pyrimidine-nucleoside phosphorylase
VTPYAVIRKKRDGGRLSRSEMKEFFGAFLRDEVADYQVSALLMAIFLRGMDDAELGHLVGVMLESGAVLDLGTVPGVKVDKHSTGGVGDKVSLVLAPLVSACGVPVPMMSGRGLGHTGGTVDKLESIPGFRIGLDLEAFRRQLERIGCALITQTPEIAPLDRRLYALRDVTGTVESIPLIASSIMSKKLAEGIDALVLDVKVGSGAFLPERAAAEQLARTMIAIGAAHGRRVTALLTAMDRPLGHAIGNALEVEEAVELLRGAGPADVRELTLGLAAEMLVLGRAADDRAAGLVLAGAALDDGRALETMARVIEAQGGNPGVLDDPAVLPQAPVRHVLESDRDGIVTSMDVRAIGLAAVALGAGRTRADSTVDPAVGLHLTLRPGDRVARGEPVGTVHAREEEAARRAAAAVLAAVEISDRAATPLPLVLGRLA